MKRRDMKKPKVSNFKSFKRNNRSDRLKDNKKINNIYKKNSFKKPFNKRPYNSDNEFSEHKNFKKIYILSRSRKQYLMTLSLAPGSKVYNEVTETLAMPKNLLPNLQKKKNNDPRRNKTDSIIRNEIASIEKRNNQNNYKTKLYEFRVWNPFRSKIAAALVLGLRNFYVKPFSKVLYLGAASGTTVSHCSDIISLHADIPYNDFSESKSSENVLREKEKGKIYAVEFSLTSCQMLMEVCNKRRNIIPIMADARKPETYNLLVEPVDCIFIDVSQRDQSRILAMNCKEFLKDGGHFMMSLKAGSIDSSVDSEIVFENEIRNLESLGLEPEEMVRLEPYEKNHCFIQGIYRRKTKKK